MRSYFERLVEERGEEAAKQYMRSLRAKRVNNIGGGFRNKETQKKAAKTRKLNAAGDRLETPNA